MAETIDVVEVVVWCRSAAGLSKSPSSSSARRARRSRCRLSKRAETQVAAKFTRSGIDFRDGSDSAESSESASLVFEVRVEFDAFFFSSDDVDDFLDALIGDN